MHNITLEKSEQLDESTFKTKLDNGLTIYICKKKGFKKKIGLFGTKYGSLINDFVDINTGKRTKVPDGIAHFLEHKLFEKEGKNALDLFSEMGVDSNAYTTFDQTVYYFETINKFEESIAILVKLIKEPYFTDENVAREQGIIGQEISMYYDDPSYRVYFNTLRAMYVNNPVKIDIAGTIESISHITKDMLYTCYNTFYSPQNMFFIVVGDVDVDETIDLIEKNIKKYPESKNKEEIQKYVPQEPKEIAKKKIEEKMDIFLPQLCIGYKLDLVDGKQIEKNEIVADFVSEMYFSKQSKFFQKLYSSGKINSAIDLQYEASMYFSHVIISTTSTKIDEIENEIIDYINKIKVEDVDKNLFNMIKRKKIGETILSADNLVVTYRRIIESILYGTDVYLDVELLNTISKILPKE